MARVPRMVGSEKSWGVEAVVRLAHIGGPGKNILARPEYVDAETAGIFTICRPLVAAAAHRELRSRQTGLILLRPRGLVLLRR